MNTNRTFETHLNDYLPQIRKIVRKISKKEDIVDDLTQECCVRIIEKEHLWKSEKGSMSKWINALTRNMTIDHLRTQKKTVPLETDIASVPAEKEFSEEHIAWVLSQYRTLPEKQKKVLQLRYFEGMKVTDIAKDLGVTKSAVSHQIATALKILKKRAKAQGLLASLLPWNWDIKELIEGYMMNKTKMTVTSLILIGSGVAGTKVIEPLFRESHLTVHEISALSPTNSNKTLIEQNKKLLAENEDLKNNLQELRSHESNQINAHSESILKLPTGETFDQILASINNVDEATSPEEYTQLINKLSVFGEAAVPAIKQILNLGKNFIYSKASVSPFHAGKDYPSFRLGLIRALKTIKGDKATQAASSLIGNAHDPLEIYELGQIMAHGGIRKEEYKPQAIKSLRKYFRNKIDTIKNVGAIQKSSKFSKLKDEYNSIREEYRYSDEDIPDSVKSDLAQIKMKMRELSEQAKPIKILETGDLPYQMIHSLSATDDMIPLFEDYLRADPFGGECQRIYTFLATFEDSDRSFQIMEDSYHSIENGQVKGHIPYVIAGIAQINSDKAHDFLRQIFFDRVKHQDDIIRSLSTGLNIFPGHMDYWNPFERRNSSQRNYKTTKMKTVSPDTFEKVLNLLDEFYNSDQIENRVKEKIVGTRRRIKSHLKKGWYK